MEALACSSCGMGSAALGCALSSAHRRQAAVSSAAAWCRSGTETQAVLLLLLLLLAVGNMSPALLVLVLVLVLLVLVVLLLLLLLMAALRV